MTSTEIKNLPASVRARLLNLAKERREDFTGLLTRYALERFMYRLATSQHAGRFVLKGATLFAIWSDQPHRATRDLDLLGFGANDVPTLVEVFRQVCRQEVQPDGLVFDADSVKGGLIREDRIYEGVRVTLTATLARARIAVQVDVGFGDSVFPAAVSIEVPVLLDFPAPVLNAYAKETVVAEKLQAMVALGIVNSRMKDFYDIWVLARDNAFDGAVLAEAVRRTFERRGSPLPTSPPVALTTEFSSDSAKVVQWRAFVRRGRLVAGEPALDEVVASLARFLLPVLGLGEARVTGQRRWPPGGPWRVSAD
ncbi:MAG: nucleotidyl transferase AbiEii/AbiGii toxin family protein [Deltaproteobacteria bacterium]|nr:nucleotidyl transferase AbiEii/AbiGii toxin family protein [Deltaproteobacteria bacterium]